MLITEKTTVKTNQTQNDERTANKQPRTNNLKQTLKNLFYIYQ